MSAPSQMPGFFSTAMSAEQACAISVARSSSSAEAPEGVLQHVRAEAGAAHAEQDNIGKGLAGAGQVSQLGGLGLHLLDHVQPAQPAGDLLLLRWVLAPERAVFGPEPAGRILLLEPGGLLLDGGLESAQALPLPRALAGPDVTGGLAQGLAEAEIGLGDELDALHLQLLGHLVEVDPDLGQLL